MLGLQQARTDFPTSSFITVSASLTTAAGRRLISHSRHALEQQSTTTWSRLFQRQLSVHSSPGWRWRVASSDFNRHFCLLSVISKLIMRRTAANFFLCCATAASWQHCIDYNTTSARLTGLGARPAAQVSGGHIPPSTRKKKALLERSHFSTDCAFSSCSALKHASLSPYLSQSISATAVSCKLWFVWS